eukprot:CAMPEP_0198137218 /NCGR_PEP_ID=MMETSP1443-20131203/741_1 /TAXON_ID=186043 /ORGANISM="Entomoneis sp., Strain CCMP2396" /LENGTH=395 /DNA_ID=CAMNT_0043798579 /DNA_START=94 /DNA_END=1281 /DNA_ORIENTATION=-
MILSVKQGIMSSPFRRGIRFLSSLTPASSSLYKSSAAEARMDVGGPGGRSSNNGVKVAVFGGSGFLGKYVAGELGANGFMAYFANRGDDMEMRHLKLAFDLGKTRFVFYEARDEDSMREVISDADVVVNLVGKYYESAFPYQTKSFPYIGYKTNYTFEEVNVDIPKKLAQICLEMQVDHFVHVSSASASPDARSEWSRTKFAGEEAVKEIYPWATIIRPTQMFGRNDRLLTNMARFSRWWWAIYLIDGGKSLTQPVWVGDVARAIVAVCDNPEKFEGKNLDLFGPKEYNYRELAEFVDDCTRRNFPLREIPYDMARFFAQYMQYRRQPFVTPDLVDIWSEDFLPPLGSPEAYANQKEIMTLKDVGIEATPMESIMYQYLQRFIKFGHFHYVDGYH